MSAYSVIPKTPDGHCDEGFWWILVNDAQGPGIPLYWTIAQLDAWEFWLADSRCEPVNVPAGPSYSSTAPCLIKVGPKVDRPPDLT